MNASVSPDKKMMKVYRYLFFTLIFIFSINCQAGIIAIDSIEVIMSGGCTGGCQIPGTVNRNLIVPSNSRIESFTIELDDLKPIIFIDNISLEFFQTFNPLRTGDVDFMANYGGILQPNQAMLFIGSSITIGSGLQPAFGGNTFDIMKGLIKDSPTAFPQVIALNVANTGTFLNVSAKFIISVNGTVPLEPAPVPIPSTLFLLFSGLLLWLTFFKVKELKMN